MYLKQIQISKSSDSLINPCNFLFVFNKIIQINLIDTDINKIRPDGIVTLLPLTCAREIASTVELNRYSRFCL